MRLLHTSTGLFEEFIGTVIPPYAILSHTWGEDEVSFKDMTTDSAFRSKEGYAKIIMTCQLAKLDGLQYAWIDTCCIDKTSSAELSEAINSMYQWYQTAKKCYVYLVDLELDPAWRENLANCRWFTRGWTLQELIAPVDVFFFDRLWRRLFRKCEGIELLTAITRIDKDVLTDSRSLLSFSVAQRMSWAAHRVTTRVEDEAYCLLGIFDVNMPMLYGEGRKAFMRLQEEIIRICPDLSIFAWKAQSPPAMFDEMFHEGLIASAIFASAAINFAESGSFAAVKAHSTNDFFLSNQGIKIHTRLSLEHNSKQQGFRYSFPVCKTDDETVLGIRLRKCGVSQLAREDPHLLIEHDQSFPSMQSRTVYLLARLPPTHFPKCLLRDLVLHSRSRILQIKLPPEMDIVNVWPWSRWDGTDQVFFVSDNLGLDYGAARVSGTFVIGTRNKQVVLSFDFMLYSFGWANLASEKPFYAVIPWKPSNSVLADLNNKLDQYDYVSSMVEDDLEAYKIKSSSTAQYEFPDSGDSVRVNCISRRVVSDLTKCLFPFWKLEISWEVEKKSS